MSFCEHCQGQRFDRSRVLRQLRELQKEMRTAGRPQCEGVILAAINAIRDLDIPHLEPEEDFGDDVIVH